MSKPATDTPTPMPAFAPVLKPAVVDGSIVGLADTLEVPTVGKAVAVLEDGG